MPIIAILTAIGTALLNIGGFLGEAIGMVFDGIRSVLDWFISNAPRPLQLFLFLFLLVSVGNVFSKFVIGSSYACTSTNQLYQSESLIEGVGNRVRMEFFGLSETEINNLIVSNYEHIEQKADVTNVRCVGGSAKLYFYSVDLFSYNLWILLLILLYGAPLAIRYYKSMGLLH